MTLLAMTASLLHGSSTLPGRKSALAALFICACGPATAASFAVDSVVDARDANAGDGICSTSAGLCSLRAAIEESNALPGADSISLPPGTHPITLGSGDDRAARGDFDITDALRITGAGQISSVVDGNAADRVFDVHQNGSLDLSAVTVRNGRINKEGGGIRSEGALNLTNVTLSDNVGQDGGGVAVRKNTGSASLANVTFRNNSADKGGGLHVKDDVVVSITDSTFRDNSASKEGGGAQFDKGVLRVSGSVFYSNRAEKGGGLFIKGGGTNVELTNVTIADNTSSKEGGGLQKQGNGVVRLTNVTVYGNSSPLGGGVHGKEGVLNLFNTMVANSRVGADCDGTMTSLGHNLDSDGSCPFSLPGDLQNTDPLAGVLQDNGGPTWTCALFDASPARDAGNNTGCPGTDQRGVARPIDSNADNVATCDIGAYEAGLLYPDFDLAKTVTTLTDPVSGDADPVAIPGAVMQYSITLGNAGPGAADQNSIDIIDALPSDTSLVVADFDVATAGPVAFIDGTPASGLSFSFIDLASTADDLAFSNDGGASFAYSPSPGADGSDPNVTHVRITPKGFARYTGADPVAEFLLKVVVR